MKYDDILDLLESELKETALVTDDFVKEKARIFKAWTPRIKGIRNNLRTIYSIETVADIGDDGDWGSCRDFTIRLWSRLERNGIFHWRALSGGMGTHTHIFVSQSEYRGPFMVWASSSRSFQDETIVVDPLLVEPAPGNRMVREFGTTNPKSGHSKTIWPLRPEELPKQRDAAYQMVGKPIMPSSFAVNAQPPGANFYEVRRALGGNCPQSFECLDSGWFCESCPANR